MRLSHLKPPHLKPRALDIAWATRFRPERYNAGYAHGLRGGRLDRVEYLRLSFRAGFRAAKLHAREWRRRQGIVEFPMRFKFRLSSHAR
jgi:hypothetical protein